ncbi:response regulator [Cohnella silvisoli]|uniref:Response regulator n=1 Tax=Cohnella silvisoli TaxID=2873699 RepID=A0ABV1L2G9_9BACL|nr:response regulator [Cohnella silvisoli]MCD9025800.1 response regulator [Cohnella silvisoli]
MYQLLIVDDEASVADSLEMIISAQDMGIEMLHKASSGNEALEILNRYPIDIVITDIRMPEMSGIELSQEIHSRWKHTDVIFLSGYSDFEYAKHAIEIQAADYIVKPFRNERVLNTLRNVIERKEKEWQTSYSYQTALYTLQENMPSLRSNLLNNMLRGKKYAGEAIDKKADALKLPFRDGEDFIMMLVRLESEFQHYEPEDLSLMEFSITNIAEEVFDPYFRLWHSKDMYEYLVFLVRPEPDRIEQTLKKAPTKSYILKLAEKLATEMQNNVKKCLQGSISVLAGPWGQFPADVRKAYDVALSFFRNKIGTEQGLVFSYIDENEVPGRIRNVSSLYESPTFNYLFELGRWDEARSKLDDVFQEWESLGGYSEEHGLEIFWAISSSLAYILHKNGHHLYEVMGMDTEIYGNANSSRNPAKLRAWCINVLELLRQGLERENKDSRSSLVRQVQEYVGRRLAEDVSLQAISDHVNLNPSYLSRIYKIETGEGLSHYLYRLRMEKAAYYLKNTDLKIYEITSKLGYQYTPYFNKVFKQFFGVTPQEYRGDKEG